MKVDVRTKLFIVSIFSLLALIYQAPEALALLLLLNIITLFLFRVPLTVVPFIKKIIFFYLFLIIMQSFFVQDGTVLFSLGQYPLITTGGILYGVSIFLRFMILFCSALMIAGCRSSELLQGLTKLRLPYEVVFMIQVGIRFVPLLATEMQNTFNSLQLRGMDVRKIYKKDIIKSYCQIFSPIVYCVWDKAREFSILLELKGFRRYPERTYYYDIKMGKRDYITMMIYLIITFVFVLLVPNFFIT